MTISPLSQPGNNAIKPEKPTGQTAAAVAGTSSTSAGGATISFTASTNPGKGTANYVATSSPGSYTASATSSPITFSSGVFTIGQAYTFTIVKQSGSGVTSDATGSTNSITAYTIPSAPTISVARQSSETLRITLTAGANANGSTITSYQYRIKSTGAYGSWTGLSGTSGPWDIGSLSNGTSYTVQVRAVNSAGNGDGSNEPSATPYTVPDAPTLTITNTCDTVDWSWTAGGNGGSAITGYEYALSTNGGAYVPSGNEPTTGTDYPGSINNDKNTNTYTLRVRAVNAAGAGAYATATSTPWAVAGTGNDSRACGTCGTESGTYTIYSRGGCSPNRNGPTSWSGNCTTNACGGSGWTQKTGDPVMPTAGGQNYIWYYVGEIGAYAYVATSYTTCGECYGDYGRIYECAGTYCFVKDGCSYVCY